VCYTISIRLEQLASWSHSMHGLCERICLALHLNKSVELFSVNGIDRSVNVYCWGVSALY